MEVALQNGGWFCSDSFVNPSSLPAQPSSRGLQWLFAPLALGLGLAGSQGGRRCLWPLQSVQMGFEFLSSACRRCRGADSLWLRGSGFFVRSGFVLLLSLQILALELRADVAYCSSVLALITCAVAAF